MNFPLFPLFNVVTLANICVYLCVPPCIENHELRLTLRGVCVTCALEAQKQLARTSLKINNHKILVD